MIIVAKQIHDNNIIAISIEIWHKNAKKSNLYLTVFALFFSFLCNHKCKKK